MGALESVGAEIGRNVCVHIIGCPSAISFFSRDLFVGPATAVERTITLKKRLPRQGPLTRPRHYAAAAGAAGAGSAPSRPGSALRSSSARRVCMSTDNVCLARRRTTERSALSSGAIALSNP